VGLCVSSLAADVDVTRDVGKRRGDWWGRSHDDVDCTSVDQVSDVDQR